MDTMIQIRFSSDQRAFCQLRSCFLTASIMPIIRNFHLHSSFFVHVFHKKLFRRLVNYQNAKENHACFTTREQCFHSSFSLVINVAISKSNLPKFYS